ncbi:glycosyltransferase [Terrimonas alba]|uniref:glycosyltransferase n=1 Tax=Terrimonas alba TaxID=3349636 RepID=UPI0035F3EB0C
MKKVVHIIDNLKRGGAETLLHHVVTNLKGYDNYIITLTDANDFSSIEMQDIQVTSLKFNSILSLPFVVLKLRKIIIQLNPDVVHAHLPLSSLVARLSTPSSIKLFISIHNKYSDSFKKVSPRLFFLEKKLHSKRDNLLFVSDSIRKDYDLIVGIKGTSQVLHNFIADKYFAKENQLEQNTSSREKLRLVSVGSLKKQKNFETLIKAFSLLDASKFSLDIFGEGSERTHLEILIKQLQLNNINLRGSVSNVESHLKNYDAYILASRYEGFGIAPLEAAALGLPLLLSEIDVFKEVTKGYAIYFSPNDINGIAVTIRHFVDNIGQANERAVAFKPVIEKEYSKAEYIQKLIKIYNS